MSAAAVAPIAGTVHEPETLRELYAQAQVDLGNPTLKAHLRWVFWHARAVGRLEVARYALKRLELDDAEVRTRALAHVSILSMRDAYEAERPKAQLNGAAEHVIECAAYVQAAASVLEMLKT